MSIVRMSLLPDVGHRHRLSEECFRSHHVPALTARYLKTSVPWAGRDLMQGLPEQEIVVFPSGRKHSHWAVSLRPPTRDVNPLGHCRSNCFLGCYSSHLPRQSCGATRTQDISRPASAISSGLGAMNGQIRSVNPDRPQATVPATNHESPEEEDVADTATPDRLPGGCQVRTMVRC